MQRISRTITSPGRFPAPEWLGRRGGLGLLLLAGVALLGVVEPMAAQQGTVSGVVVSEQSLRPLAGAQVVAEGTGRGTITDARGRFLVTGLTGPEVVLQVRMLGYRPAERSVPVGASEVRIALSQSAIELDELVVTGTPGAVEKRAIGNTVAQIDANEVVEIAPIPTVANLINGRVAGVVVRPGTGMIGAGPRIQIRGAASFSLSDQPLIYIDGVRVNNEIASGLSVQGFGSGVVSRLNDLNPEDIESIEIIKGPAAATLYGTEASNGVVQIITKRGVVSEEPRFGFTMRQGATWFANPETRIPETFWRNPATGEVEPFNIVEQENARGTPIFSTGHLQGYSLNVSGGSETVRYYVSADYDDDEGIEPINFQERFSGRANVTVAPGEALDIAASLGVTTARTGLVYEAGAGGIWFSTIFNSPALQDTPKRGFLFVPPEAVWPVLQPKQDVNRFTGSATINHRPFGWLSQRLSLGLDLTMEEDESTIERITDPYIQQFYGSGTIAGSKFIRTRNIDYNTFDYSATATLPLRAELQSRTSVGAQYYHKFVQAVAASGTGFPAPALRTVDALAQTFGGDDYFENSTVGVFVEQQFAWRDRLFLTGAVRADDNSAFGENFDLVYYPKVSASWVIAEEPFWSVSWVDALRLRGAYGHSGQQPETFAALRTFQPVTAGSGAPAVTPQFIGNPDLAPERGEELELGFEAGLLRDRLGIDFTWYRQKTTDAILLRDVAPSLGFPGAQFVNVGALENRGFEAQVRGLVVDTRPADWNVTVNYSTHEGEVLDLGGEEFISLGSQRHHVGLPPFAWFREVVVGAELNEQGRAVNLMCDAGVPLEEGGPPVLPGGPAVSCDEASPRLYLGPSIPKYQGSVSSTLTLFNRLNLFAMFDFQGGHKAFDNNLRARCQIFNICRENWVPADYDPVLIAQMQSNARFIEFVLNDASYAKFRELSASYSIPESWAARLGASRASITVAGRNLWTWTDWTGLDPEAAFIGFGQNRLEQNNTPQLQQFLTTIHLTF